MSCLVALFQSFCGKCEMNAMETMEAMEAMVTMGVTMIRSPYYKFVGEAYTHGLMDGEALRDLDDTDYDSLSSFKII